MAVNKLIRNIKTSLLVSGTLFSTALFSQNLENRVKYNLDYNSLQTGNIKYKIPKEDSVQIESYAKKLYEGLTNEPFPKKVSISYSEDSLNGNAGEWLHDERKVLISKREYVPTLLFFMHEFGHVFAKQQKILKKSRYPDFLMSEALAICFEYATPYLVEDSILSKTLINEIDIKTRVNFFDERNRINMKMGTGFFFFKWRR